jgi:hypothetical protein
MAGATSASDPALEARSLLEPDVTFVKARLIEDDRVI